MVLLLLYGNLRGIREAGRFFAFPTYFFIVSLGLVVVAGYVREAIGHAATSTPSRPGAQTIPIGHPGSGLLYGASFIVILRAFANGGSSLTGLEAISNGVGAFREPTSRNARQTLVVMSRVLAFLVLGVTLLAHWTHAIPYASGTPDGGVPGGQVRPGHGPGRASSVFYVVQFATMLILYTGGQHQLQRLPVPGQLRGRGRLPAPAADPPGPPAGLLQRDHRAHRGGPGC